MNKIKIFVIGTRGFPNVPGGVEKHCEQLYPRLAKLGCEVTVATRSPYISPERRCHEWENLKFIHLWAFRSKHLEAIAHSFCGVLVSRFYSPDILHIHAIGPSLLVPMAKLLGLKVVVTNHGPDYQRQKWGRFAKKVLSLGEALAAKFADKVIVISQTIKNDLEEKYGRRNLELILNGVDLPEVVPAGEVLERYGLEPRKYVFTACRFVPEKGLLDLIAAYQRIENPDFKLVIAGDAHFENECSRAIKNAAGVDERVILPGFISGRPLGELYSNAALFVLPSHHEGLPIALLEAISYHLPVLASDIPPNREVSLPAFRYFPVGDVPKLSEQMVSLFERGITAEEIEQQDRILNQDYNWDRIAEQTFQVYEKLASQPLK